jgi:hypothetical protein
MILYFLCSKDIRPFGHVMKPGFPLRCIVDVRDIQQGEKSKSWSFGNLLE